MQKKNSKDDYREDDIYEKQRSDICQPIISEDECKTHRTGIFKDIPEENFLEINIWNLIWFDLI